MENIKPFSSTELLAVFHKYYYFLNEVRKRIFFTLSVFGVAAIIGFLFYERIIELLINTLSLQEVNIVFTSPFQFINLAVACGVATGLVVVFPLLIFQILAFLKPALKRKEFRVVTSFLPFSVLLFLIGFAFGAYIMRWQIEISLSRSVALGIDNVLDISRLLSTVLMTSAFMGVGFQFPVVLLLLLRIGILNREALSRRRKWVYLGSFIFAILLPADSIVADIFLSLPMIFLFELTLLLDRIYKREQRARQRNFVK